MDIITYTNDHNTFTSGLRQRASVCTMDAPGGARVPKESNTVIRFASKVAALVLLLAPLCGLCADTKPFVPLGRWRIDVYVDGVPQNGPRALDPFRRTSRPIIADVRKEGSIVTMVIESTPIVILMIPDGVERPDAAGFTRYFYLAPNALGHTHRSNNGVFDSDVCTPSADGKTIDCPGVMGDAQGKLHKLWSVWRKIGD